MPILANSRSQRAHFDNNPRFKTHSFGIGDARISVYRWMLDPAKSNNGNFQIGFKGGLKNVSVALGGRLEGIPVHDLVGGSEGFRRPGYIVSAEPQRNYHSNGNI